MGFSNTVQKITERLLGSVPNDLEEQTTKGSKAERIIDMPELSSPERSSFEGKKLKSILDEDEVKNRKRLASLKDRVEAGSYDIESSNLANSILRYPLNSQEED